MNDEGETVVPESSRLEEAYVRNSLLLGLLEDLIHSTTSSHAQRAEVARQEVEVDKNLLQLLNVECREGEEKGMKALEIVGLMKGSRMLEAARKVAGRYGRGVLEEKILELEERRLMGEDGDGDELA